MQPHEIKPDTELCTIIGYNAQTGLTRKYFNKILKNAGLNATAIALNITDEKFEFTMQNIADSKVDKMIVEFEFGADALEYCQSLNAGASALYCVDFIEVKDGKVEGYNLTGEARALFSNPAYLDEPTLQVAKLMLLANRWYGVTIDIDEIPTILGDAT
jgi:shikimate 5-dehydrogenase